MRRKCSPDNHPSIGASIAPVADSYLKLKMFNEALAMVEEYDSWKLLAGSSRDADAEVEAMRKEATEGLAQQRKITKLKKKKAAKKGKVAKVTAEMVVESDKHAAELLEMIGDESIAASGTSRVQNKKGAAKSKKGKSKKKGKKKRR